MSLFAAVGPAIYEITSQGQILRAFQPFESAEVPVQVAAGTEGSIYVAAGPGGGPRISAFHSYGLYEQWSVFVGDPASRSGVQLSAMPESALKALPHPLFPASPRSVAEAQANLDRIPARLAAPMSDDRVYVFDRPSLTDLPEFAHLRGIPTGPTFDGDATYDQVRAAATPGAAFVRADSGWAAGHEAGHLYAYATGLDLGPDEHEQFVDTFLTWGI